MKPSLYNAISNIAQSFYDKMVEANVQKKLRSGVKSVIIRRELGSCCDWCKGIAGVYDYSDAPADIFRRHDNCRCMVTVRTERGTYQDAWSKREFQSQKEARLAREKEIVEAEMRTAQSNRLIREYLETASPNKGTIVVEDGYDQGSHKEEMKFAEWLYQAFGGDIVLRVEANVDCVKSADYLWNGRLWDLKTVSTEKAADSAIRKGLKQIKGNPGGVFLDYGEIDVSLEKVMGIAKERMQRSAASGTDVIIVQNGRVVAILRKP